MSLPPTFSFITSYIHLIEATFLWVRKEEFTHIYYISILGARHSDTSKWILETTRTDTTSLMPSPWLQIGSICFLQSKLTLKSNFGFVELCILNQVLSMFYSLSNYFFSPLHTTLQTHLYATLEFWQNYFQLSHLDRDSW